MLDIVQLIAIATLSGLFVMLGIVGWEPPYWLNRGIDLAICACMMALFVTAVYRLW